MTLNQRQILSPQFIECAAHVKLNKSMWWNKAKTQFVIAALFSAEKELSFQEIIEFLQTAYNIRLEYLEVENICKNLERKK